MGTPGAAVFGQLLFVIAALAAAAPFILSIMARSAISIAVSIVLLVAAGLTFFGPTVIHQILSAVLYLAALVSASIIYVGFNIECGLKDVASAVARVNASVKAPIASPAPPPPPPARAVDTPADSDWAKIKSEVPSRRR
jgi:hypothetical protein